MQTNKDHDDFSDRKFRETLNITIINNFLDFQYSSNYATLSSFFHHMRNSFKEIPHIFVSNCISDCSENSCNLEELKQKNESQLSAAFTEWLMMWLLRVLSHDCASAVHNECKDLFMSLLHLVRAYNPKNFRQYILHLMALLTELIEFVDKFEENEEGIFKIQNCFQTEKVLVNEDKELVLVDISVTFSNPAECENLQEKITSLLGSLTLDITQFLSDKCDYLSKIYCLQIELGNLPLKSESLKALNALLKINGLLLSLSQVNYIFSCVQAVISFCCCYEGLACSDIISLEQSTATCLLEISENINKPENKYMLNNFILGKFSKNLLEVVFKSRFLDTCKEFQSALVKSIIVFIEHGYQNGYSISKNVLHDFICSLHELFLKFQRRKILVPLFVYLIKSSQKQFLKSKTNPETVVQQDSSNALKSLTFEQMQEYSQLWSLLYNSLNNYVNCAKDENALNGEVLTAYLEILLRSFCEVVNGADKQLYEIPMSSKKSMSCDRSLPKHLIELINFHVHHCITEKFSLQTYEEIISLYEMLLAVQDLVYLTHDQLITVCNVISLPFIIQWSNEDYFDLQCSFIAADFVKRLSVSFTSSSVIKCLRLLVSLPLDISHKWKYHVLLFCLSHEEDVVRIATIRLLPYVFYTKIIPEQNLSDIVPYLLNRKSPEVLSEVALAVGRISCVIADSCALFRKRSSDGSVILEADLLCKHCGKINGEMQVPDSQPLNCNSCLADLFMQLLNQPSEVVRRGCVESILSYFAHNKMLENILAATMQLLVDPDIVIQNKFCDIIEDIVRLSVDSKKDCEWLQKVEEILVVKLKSALVSSKCSGNIHFQKQ